MRAGNGKRLRNLLRKKYLYNGNLKKTYFLRLSNDTTSGIFGPCSPEKLEWEKNVASHPYTTPIDRVFSNDGGALEFCPFVLPYAMYALAQTCAGKVSNTKVQSWEQKHVHKSEI